MNTINTDIAIIGGGPAGLAAALGAYECGIKNIIVFERGDEAGGILRQCIHTGFGLQYFREELTGPEYSERFLNKVSACSAKIFVSAMVINIHHDNSLSVVSRHEGYLRVYFKALIIATGCRERSYSNTGRQTFRNIYCRAGAVVYQYGRSQNRSRCCNPWLRRYWADHGQTSDTGRYARERCL